MKTVALQLQTREDFHYHLKNLLKKDMNLLKIEGTRNLLYDYNLELFEKERIEKGETKAAEHMKRLKNMSSKEKEKQKILRDYNKLYK